MNTDLKQSTIRECAVNGHIQWSRHALQELATEIFSLREVEAALTRAEIIEDYPVLRRFLPDCLVLCLTEKGEPVHCVVAVNIQRGYVLVVTVYGPSMEVWKDDWRTRK